MFSAEIKCFASLRRFFLWFICENIFFRKWQPSIQYIVDCIIIYQCTGIVYLFLLIFVAYIIPDRDMLSSKVLEAATLYGGLITRTNDTRWTWTLSSVSTCLWTFSHSALQIAYSQSVNTLMWNSDSVNAKANRRQNTGWKIRKKHNFRFEFHNNQSHKIFIDPSRAILINLLNK